MLGLALLSAAAALLPVGYLLVRTFEAPPGRIVELVFRERTLQLLVRSLTLTVTVTAATVVIGVALAVLVVRCDLPGRRLLGVLAPLPLAVPSYVAAFGVMGAVPQLHGLPGAVLVLTAVSYPYVYLPVAAALRGADPAQEEVAASLGRRGLGLVMAVTARQVRPAALAGGLLVALYVLSDFGAVSLMRYDVFTRVIHTSYRASFDRTPAAVLGLLLVLVTIAVTAAESKARARAEQVRVGAGAARRPARWNLGGWRTAAVGFSWLAVGVGLFMPLATLGYWLWVGRSGTIDPARLLSATASTAMLGLLAAGLTLVAAIPVGVLAARYRGRLVGVIEQSAYIGHSLPGIVVALSLVFFGIRVVPGLYQELPLLLLAYVVLFLPLAAGSVRSSVALSSPTIEEVARSLGHRGWSVLTRVTLPIATPGLLAGTALVMLAVMKELPATLLLRPTGTDTLATTLWSQTGAGAFAAAAPYAGVLVVLAAIPAGLLSWLSERRTSAPSTPAPIVQESQ